MVPRNLVSAAALAAFLALAAGLAAGFISLWVAVMAATLGTVAMVAYSRRSPGTFGSLGRRRTHGAPDDTAGPDRDLSSLEAVIEGLHDATLVLDGEAHVLAANQQARLLMPVVMRKHVSQSTRSPELLSAISRALTAGRQERGETRLRGSVETTLSIIATPLGSEPARRPSAGTPALLVVLRDVTDREQLTRLRADFVANASHELRTPLTSLKGFLETIRGPAKNDHAAREKFLDIMQEQADRMSRLIEDLLSLSRIEMREHVRPQEKADLAEIVEYVARTMGPLAEQAGISLETSGSDAAIPVTGDRDELIQLTQNLAQNGLKYGRRGGRLTLAVRREGPRAVLAVSDDGIGIAPEHLPRLTERFYRVSAKDSRERGGTGLGLAIVKHIVNRHQGELRIESTPGKGSKFTVLLPPAL